MNKVYIGKIVNTHGIKGEIRLLSDFPFKDKVFVVGNSILIDDIEYKINSYRRHKMFDMITLEGYNNINDVLFLMKKKVYFDKDKLVLSDEEILDEYLIKFNLIFKNMVKNGLGEGEFNLKKLSFIGICHIICFLNIERKKIII